MDKFCKKSSRAQSVIHRSIQVFCWIWQPCPTAFSSISAASWSVCAELRPTNHAAKPRNATPQLRWSLCLSEVTAPKKHLQNDRRFPPLLRHYVRFWERHLYPATGLVYLATPVTSRSYSRQTVSGIESPKPPLRWWLGSKQKWPSTCTGTWTLLLKPATWNPNLQSRKPSWTREEKSEEKEPQLKWEIRNERSQAGERHTQA